MQYSFVSGGGVLLFAIRIMSKKNGLDRTKSNGLHGARIAVGGFFIVAAVLGAIFVWNGMRASPDEDADGSSNQEPGREELLSEEYRQERADNLNQEVTSKLTEAEGADDLAEKAAALFDAAELQLALSNYAEARSLVEQALGYTEDLEGGDVKSELIENGERLNTAIGHEEAFSEQFSEDAN